MKAPRLILPWPKLCRLADSSPIVAIVSRGLNPVGDWVNPLGHCTNGSGEVPHDELAPPALELEEADGELCDVPGCESKLLRESFELLPFGTTGLKILAAIFATSSFICESRPT